MKLTRRELLRTAALGTAATWLPPGAYADAMFSPSPGPWRSFQTVKTIALQKPAGAMQAWVPLATFRDDTWFKPSGSSWTTNARFADIKREPNYGAEFLHLVWADGETAPVAEITSRFATRDRATDWSSKSPTLALSDAEFKLYTAATALLPTGGLVKETADKIIKGANDDIDRARRIYDWIVDNTARNPKTRGCGTGDIESMLKTGDLTGKCADLNALYVGLARAAGLPARDVYGLRVSPSKFGYKSLGAGTEVVTKAQHCRAEVFLTGYGWVPVDPADVRKVMLEEPPGNLTPTDAKVHAARKALFGAWEMNWLAYNVAHDIALPGSSGPKADFLMYPIAEVAGMRIDHLDPDAFTYKITAKELPT